MHMPRRPEQPYLRFYALGGLGEVGMNCAVFEADGRMLLVDCGVTFPESLHYGIDLIVPDFSWLIEHADDIEALVITHGHMDHIGAVPWLLEDIDVPVYAPEMAIELLRGMLDDRDLLDVSELHVVDSETILQLGPFEVEFPQVNHSIPQSHGLAIHTDLGLFVHTGDFKVDPRAIDEPPFDEARFRSYGEEGVLALFADSTNIETPGHSPSERDVRDAISDVVAAQEGRVFAALFSSNVVRMQSLLYAAERTHRDVVLLGRSVDRTLRAAERIGALEIPESVSIIDNRECDDVPDRNLLLICTGSQAEPRAALSRLSKDTYPRMRLRASDTVLFSSRTIPGNERWVGELYDRLARHNVRIITPREAPIHASGHGFREDLRQMLEFVQPQIHVPVHGDHRYLKKHAALGESVGIEHHHILDNGDILEFTEDGSRVVGNFEANRVLIDGTMFDRIDGEAFRKRRQIARAGIVSVQLVVSKKSLQLRDAPTITPIGAFAQNTEDGEILLQALHEVAERVWSRLNKKTARDSEAAAESVRTAIRKRIRQEARRKPLVIVHVIYA